jgi:hypothetical protein
MDTVDTRTLPHRFHSDVVKQVDALIDIGLKESPEAYFLDIKEILLEVGGAMYEDNVCADDIAVHEKNRSELGLNPRDFHRNGVTIIRGGCNPDRLHDATSIELAPYGKHRLEQLKFNENIASKSEGIMQMPHGKERLGSLGCSHFGQLVKATRGNCKTPEPYLQDAHGRLSVSHLGAKDARFGKICNTGWRHLKLVYDCQVAWPRLPTLIQKALNASNQVPTQSTELETAVSISEFLQLSDKASIAKAVEAVEASSACKGYVDKIGKIVQFYVGGADAPVIKRLHAFHSICGGSGKWGNEFTAAIADMEAGLGSASAFTRESLMTCAMVSTKVLNGVFQLLGPIDIRKALAHAGRKEFEERCVVALKLVRMAEALPHRDAQKLAVLWGMLMTRWCLIATNKEQHNNVVERIEFKTMDNVFGMFADGLDKLVGEGCPFLIKACPWPRFAIKCGALAPKTELSSNDGNTVAMTSDMVTSPIYVAMQKGFGSGDYVMEKTSKRTYRIIFIHHLGVEIYSVGID